MPRCTVFQLLFLTLHYNVSVNQTGKIDLEIKRQSVTCCKKKPSWQVGPEPKNKIRLAYAKHDDKVEENV